MNIKKVRIGIVGTGRLATQIVYPSLTYIENAKLTAVCDGEVALSVWRCKDVNCPLRSGVMVVMSSQFHFQLSDNFSTTLLLACSFVRIVTDFLRELWCLRLSGVTSLFSRLDSRRVFDGRRLDDSRLFHRDRLLRTSDMIDQTVHS
ncbi:TPA: hypothetical protein EYN98_24605 [Candidatus Poribacteria bacterium]|nr:hypothetical protein [Candidatus Poribacteria bacterium]HIC00423.1 hypothetical protein [Candidatus Poribacteria bacterium]